MLGPGWKCEEAPRGNKLLSLVIIGVVLFGVLNVVCGGMLLALPPNPNPKPDATPMPEGVMWGLLGAGIVLAIAGTAAFFWARSAGGAIWETICKR